LGLNQLNTVISIRKDAEAHR
jgi:hypothetical protein